MVGCLNPPSARSSAMPSFMRSAHPFHCPSPTAPASPSGTALAVKVADGFCRCNKDSYSKLVDTSKGVGALPSPNATLPSVAALAVRLPGGSCTLKWIGC